MASDFFPLLVEDGHIWGRTSVAGDYIVCKKCGAVMKKQGKNAPCGGIVKVWPRGEHAKGQNAD